MKLTLNLIQRHYMDEHVSRTWRGIELKQPTFLGNNLILVFPEGKEVDENYLDYSFCVDSRLDDVERTFGIDCHGCNPVVYTGRFVGSSKDTYYIEPLSPHNEGVNVAIISMMTLTPKATFVVPENVIASWRLLWSETMTIVYFMPIPEQQRPELADWFMDQCEQQKSDDQAKA